jgi:hypothetical protein
MTWFVQLQFANEILAARETEANHVQLERLAAGGQVSEGRSAPVGLARRVGARVALVVGRVATRLASALDSEAVRAA